MLRALLRAPPIPIPLRLAATLAMHLRWSHTSIVRPCSVSNSAKPSDGTCASVAVRPIDAVTLPTDAEGPAASFFHPHPLEARSHARPAPEMVSYLHRTALQRLKQCQALRWHVRIGGGASDRRGDATDGC